MTIIEMDNKTKRFYQGVSAANEVLEAHQDVDFPDHETRVRLFWFYAGALAAGDHGCETEEDFTHFILGANTRTPQPISETSDIDDNEED